jgi:2'-5' RNA ligase
LRNHAIAYWLIPARPERDLLRKIINILADQYDAPRFEPHLTIFAMAKDRRSLSKILKEIDAAPIRLTPRGIDFTSTFTKTLFLQLSPNKSFEKLIGDLRRATNSRTSPPINPHVSLVYKRIPAAEKKELAATIKLPLKEIVFTSIKAVGCASPTRTRADVEAWRVLATKKLRQ